MEILNKNENEIQSEPEAIDIIKSIFKTLFSA